MDRLFFPVDIADKSHDAFWLMVGDLLGLRASSVLEPDGQIRIQIRRFMEAAFDLRGGKICPLKDLTVRKEIDLASRTSGLADGWKQPVHQLNGGNATLKMIMMDHSSDADLHIHIL